MAVNWNGKQIVPADWVAMAITPSEINPEYGLLWWLANTGPPRPFAAVGSYGQRIVVIPGGHAVVAILSATPADITVPEGDLDSLINHVLAPALSPN